MIRHLFKSKLFYLFLILSAIGLLGVRTGILQLDETIFIVGAILTFTYIVSLEPAAPEIKWNDKSPKNQKQGAREDIMYLSWMLFGKTRKVTFGGMKTVRETATKVFESVGLELENPQDFKLLSTHLSPAILQALTDKKSSTEFTERQLNQLLTVLKKIETIVPQTQPNLNAKTQGIKHD